MAVDLEKNRKNRTKRDAGDRGEKMKQSDHQDHKPGHNKPQSQPENQQEKKAVSPESELADDLKKSVEKDAAQEEIKKLKDELAQANDRALRSLAELENFRQRKNRELADDRKYASMDLARDILPVWDNMGRAIEAADQNSDLPALVEGMKMMHKQFLDIFQKNHIEKIDAAGKVFDPHFHESIAMLPSDEPAGTVLVDTQAGFTLFDRVVRPTQVVVAAAKPAAKSDAKPADNKTESEKAE